MRSTARPAASVGSASRLASGPPPRPRSGARAACRGPQRLPLDDRPAPMLLLGVIPVVVTVREPVAMERLLIHDRLHGGVRDRAAAGVGGLDGGLEGGA